MSSKTYSTTFVPKGISFGHNYETTKVVDFLVFFM